MSRPRFEELRRVLVGGMVAAYFAIAPSSVPPWRLEQLPRPAAVLLLGEPTPSVAVRPGAGFAPDDAGS